MSEQETIINLNDEKLWYVYAIECNNQSVYIGQTVDLIKRWEKHCSGIGSRWTKRYKPIRLFYFEIINCRQDALKREKQLKTTTGRKFLKAKLMESCVSPAINLLNSCSSQVGEPAEELLKRILADKEKKSKKKGKYGSEEN